MHWAIDRSAKTRYRLTIDAEARPRTCRSGGPKCERAALDVGNIGSRCQRRLAAAQVARVRTAGWRVTVSVRPLCTEPHHLLAAWSADAEKLLRGDVCLFQDRAECAFRDIAWMIGQRGVSVLFRVELDLVASGRLTIELESKTLQSTNDIPIAEAG